MKFSKQEALAYTLDLLLTNMEMYVTFGEDVESWLAVKELFDVVKCLAVYSAETDQESAYDRVKEIMLNWYQLAKYVNRNREFVLEMLRQMHTKRNILNTVSWILKADSTQYIYGGWHTD